VAEYRLILEYQMKQTASQMQGLATHERAPGAVLSRRVLLAAATAIAVGVSPGTGHAVTIIKGTVIGQQDWLYLVWDDPRRADFAQINKVTEIVEKAIAILRAARIDVVLAFVPAKSRVYRAFLPDDFRFTPETDRRYAVSLERLRKSGAIVPDLATVFADILKAKPDDKVFFKNDTHWTALGAEAAAKAIAQEMKAQLKLPPSPRPGANIGPAVTKVHVKSDLSLVLPPKEHPDETYQVHEVVAAKGKASLLDDDRPDVVVVGSSYMQPKYNFAEMLSNQLNRPVELVWKVHLVGPYKTLLSYVTSESFKKQRPRAIVWNFLEIDMELMPDNQGAWRENVIPPDTFLLELAAAVKP
jgi:alginate O-acetyltransferase complex protein AlgJ